MPALSDPRPLLRWYEREARDLPWRRPGVSGWEVLVSEVMLQQTPVPRVLPVYEQWMRTWPTAPALAADSPAAAIRGWERLGYPRRALWLHAAAVAIDRWHEGCVPREREALRALPGVGEYTAAAVAAFAYRERTVVLDTNIRRVLARLLGGEALPTQSVTRPERDRADRWLPADGREAARRSVALMELGALVCRATNPACTRCPLIDVCRWRADGYPAYDGPPRTTQRYEGTDRQCRGAILAVLRSAVGPVGPDQVRTAWPDDVQRDRALASLVADGLAVSTRETLHLPA